MADLSFGSTAFPRALEVRQKLYQSGLEGTSTRFRTLDRLDAFYNCLEYKHLDKDWNGYPADNCETISPDVVLPLGFVQPESGLKVHQRRPTAPLRLTPMVVDRFTDLLFGDEHKPKVVVEDDPIANDFLEAVMKKSHFWTAMTLARSYGGSMGSTLVTVSLKPDRHRKVGKFVVKAHSPKTIHDIIWEDPDSKIPMGVLIQYMFFRETEVLDQKTGHPTGKVQQTPFLYRRIIDEEMDVVFHPAPIQNASEMPEMRVDMDQSHRHGLGRFPGVWIQNLPSSEDIDGISDCDGAYQMFEAIDRQIAQQHKALLVNQDPTLVISQDPKLAKMGAPIHKGSENALNVGPGGAAAYLEMSGSAQTIAAAFVKDLRQAAMDKCGVVLADPQTITGAAQSALAIRLLYKPMLNRAAKLREQYGSGIETLASIILEFARNYIDPIQYEGRVETKNITFDLPKKIVERDPDPMNPDAPPAKTFVQRHPGTGSLVTVAWGEFFSPTPTDTQIVVNTLGAAVLGNLIDTETGIQLAARSFGIEDVEGLKRRVLEQIQSKKDEQEAAMAQMYAQQSQLEPEPGAVPEPGVPEIPQV